MKNNTRMLMGVSLVAAAGIGGTALAAGVGFGTSTPRAGQGTRVIGGFFADTIRYTLATTAASQSGQINSVTFKLYRGANTSGGAITSGVGVRAQLRTNTTYYTWAACSYNATPAAWVCPTRGANIGSASLGVQIVAWDL